MKTTLIATAALLTFAQLASASSDSAWKALNAKATGTCIGQSRMVSPEATAPVAFDDATGKVAVLLREKNVKSNKLLNLICLYDKKTGKASIGEYQWLGN